MTGVDAVPWDVAERVVNDSVVDKYLEFFANNPQHDEAVLLVRKIMSIERNKEYEDD